MRRKIGTGYLAAAFVTAVVFLVAIMAGARYEKNRYADLQLSAALTMKEAEAYIKAQMEKLGIEPDPEDLNRMLLVGPEFTELTTTPGSPDAKRTSLNPDFAAAMVRYYTEAGLKMGDTVAIGTSGSFPAFAIASVIAADQMGLRAKVIASLGASMHGATRVEYNIFDIILALKEGGFADFELTAISRGSANDQGGSVLEGLLYEGTAELAEAICLEVSGKTGAEFIDINDLAENIQHRLALFGDVDLFVNVGGASVNNGVGTSSLNLPAGLVMDFANIPQDNQRGLVFEYLARGIPIINLLNVKQLAADNGIPYDAVPMPMPEEDTVYATVHYNKVLVVFGIICTVLILASGIILPHLRRKRR